MRLPARGILLATGDLHDNPEHFRNWRSNVDTTNSYATACSLLILQFPLDHLPIHQR